MGLLERWRERRERRLCDEARDRIDEIIDAEIPSLRKRARLERHVEACVNCGANAESIRQLKEAVARVGRDPDPQVKARLLEAVDRVRSGDV